MFVSLIRDLSTPGEEDPISLQVVIFLDCKIGNVLIIKFFHLHYIDLMIYSRPIIFILPNNLLHYGNLIWSALKPI